MRVLVRHSRIAMRLLALLLLLLSPGLGGWAMQVLHPCPAEASHAPAHGGQGVECHCFGSCNASPMFQTASAPTVAMPIPPFALTIPLPAEPERPVARRLTLLHPPATAPPVQS
jgi:hypothetical protein